MQTTRFLAIVPLLLFSGCDLSPLFSTLGLKQSSSSSSSPTSQTPSSTTGSANTAATPVDSSVALVVGGPFYIDSTGGAVALNGATIDSTTVPGTITLTLDSTTYAKVSTLSIGYSLLSYPNTAVLSAQDLAKIKTGVAMPFDVTVSSPDGTKAQKYLFQVVQQSPIDSNIVSITATVKHQELEADTQVLDNSQASALLKNTFLPVTINDPAFDYYQTLGTTYSAVYVPANTSTELGAYYEQGSTQISATTALQTFAPIAVQVDALSLLNATWAPSPISLTSSDGLYSRQEVISEQSSSISNTSVLSYLAAGALWYGQPAYSAHLVTDPPISIGLQYFNSGNSFTGTPASSMAATPVVISATITATVQAQFLNTLSSTTFDNTTSNTYITVPSSSAGSAQSGPLTVGSNGSYYITNGQAITVPATNSASLSWPDSLSKSYSPQGDYFLFYTISITKSDSNASFSNIVSSTSLIASATANGNNLVLTFNDPGAPSVDPVTGAFTCVPKQTGIVATFTLTMGSGATQNYALSLE